MAAYRELRNCAQHNREPTDIERQLGEAAMTWLQRILDQYEDEAQDFVDDPGAPELELAY